MEKEGGKALTLDESRVAQVVTGPRLRAGKIKEYDFDSRQSRRSSYPVRTLGYHAKDKAAWEVKLICHHLVLRLAMCGAEFPFPSTCLCRDA
jgi:hypothetical protein